MVLLQHPPAVIHDVPVVDRTAADEGLVKGADEAEGIDPVLSK